MRQKAIEKIPYRKAAEAGKKYDYTATCYMQTIAGTEHLFLEVYQNRKGVEEPCLRAVYTETDWGLYFPHTGVWSGAGIRSCTEGIWRGSYETVKKTFLPEAEEDVIWKFAGSVKRSHSTWLSGLVEVSGRIRNQRWKKSNERRQARLKEREANTPELPGDLKEWAEWRLFGGMHFLYYKRSGRRARIACSACGKISDVLTARLDTYEGQFEHIHDTPVNGTSGKCPACGAYGIWKAQGKTKGVYGVKKYCFVAQPYKTTGAVVRYIQVEKLYRLDTIPVNKREEMYEAGEDIFTVEIARRYLEPGKKSRTDYQKYSGYTGENFWDDCNTAYGGITINDAPVYERSYDMLRGTAFAYSGAEAFSRDCPKYNMMDYMERYMEYPSLELLAKAGMYKTVKKMVMGYCGIIANGSAKKPEDFFGIRKERMKLLTEVHGDIDFLEAAKKEKRMGARWTMQQFLMVCMTELRKDDLEVALKYMGMETLKNRLERYSGCRIPEEPETEMRSHARERLRVTARLYVDYLRMREQRGYDMHNTVYLFPRALEEAHNRMVKEVNRDLAQKEKQEKERQYQNIRKNYRKLRNRYFFEDDRYLIRPARSASEIIQEGRILHHCVGGNTYLSNHDSGKSIILFLRFKERPETPYYTVEIREDRIIQWYGESDKKPNKEEVQAWLDRYVAQLGEHKGERKIGERIA